VASRTAAHSRFQEPGGVLATAVKAAHRVRRKAIEAGGQGDSEPEPEDQHSALTGTYFFGADPDGAGFAWTRAKGETVAVGALGFDFFGFLGSRLLLF
jgi:hypothetical protein